MFAEAALDTLMVMGGSYLPNGPGADCPAELPDPALELLLLLPWVVFVLLPEFVPHAVRKTIAHKITAMTNLKFFMTLPLNRDVVATCPV
jgi:hypothetical protein